jgi:predicted tellurium resistance membrane protein TerC
MHRRPLGRGRQLAALAAVIVIVGCLLPWWQFGGTSGELSKLSGNAFEGSSILVFFAALATIALLALPYAAGDKPVGIDRSLSYAAVAIVGWIGLLLRAIDLATKGALALPDRAPGLWLATLGLIVLSRAVYDLARERAGR